MLSHELELRVHLLGTSDVFHMTCITRVYGLTASALTLYLDRQRGIITGFYYSQLQKYKQTLS